MLRRELIKSTQNNSISNSNSNIIISQPPSPTIEYKLNNHSFDPFKSSPPSNFLVKLQQRMDKHKHKHKSSTISWED
jgi:hypothetical protein